MNGVVACQILSEKAGTKILVSLSTKSKDLLTYQVAEAIIGWHSASLGGQCGRAPVCLADEQASHMAIRDTEPFRGLDLGQVAVKNPLEGSEAIDFDAVQGECLHEEHP